MISGLPNAKRKLLYMLPIALFATHEASAVGFLVNPTSHMTGIANAGSTVYDNSVATIITNPAAMSLMSQKQVGGNLSLVIPDWDVNEKWNCSAEDNCADSGVANLAVIPSIGLIRPMDNEFTWGIGLGALAGVGFDYGDSWGGRAIITENELQVVQLVNSISWRMNEKWTFGGGVGVTYGFFEQKQDLPRITSTGVNNLESLASLAGDLRECQGVPPIQKPGCVTGAIGDSDFDPAELASTIDDLTSYASGESGTRVKLEGDDIGASVILGTTYEFMPGHRLGLMYHYMTDFSFEGNAKINGELLSDEPKQSPHMTLKWAMPDRFVVSGSHVITEDFKFYWDFERVFFDTFDRTDLRMDGYPLLKIDRNFEDANRYAIGGEYTIDNQWTAQIGFSYDESPVDDSDRMPDIPVDDIIKTTFGAIYQVNEQLNVHGFLAVEFLGDTEIEQLASIDGHKIGESIEMDSDAVLYVVGVSFGYKF